MSDHKETDQITGVETTGHEWDGIKELNNPLPRWWLWFLYATILYSIIYTIVYPAWPGITGSTGGTFGWSSRGDVISELALLEDSRRELATTLTQTDLTDVSSQPELMQFAVAGGSSAFKVYCSQCHGSGAAGGSIYPNLIDDDWIWGGSVDEIYTTLQHGIRYIGDDDTRDSLMPAFGADDILEREQIMDVTSYVLSLSGSDANAAIIGRGKVIYQENCAVCHGDNGEGDKEFGAPALNDAIWLYGSTHEEIVAQIVRPKQGVMPGWKDRLSDATIRQLSLYVHSLGGGE